MQQQEEALWRLPQVVAATGYRRSSIYRLINLGQFPRPIKIGERASAWVAHEVRTWITGRIKLSRKAEPREREGAEQAAT